MATSNYSIVPGEEIQRMNELTPAAFRLLMFLRLCRNSTTGKCCPSLQTCAEAIDVHPKNVFKVRKELVEKKFLEFQGDDVTFLISAKSSKNATTEIANKEDKEGVAKTLPDGSENATAVAKTLPESRKRYPMVAKTLPDGSENATAYKEEHTKEHTKEHTAVGADGPPFAPAFDPADDAGIAEIHAMNNFLAEKYNLTAPRTDDISALREFTRRQRAMERVVGELRKEQATLELLEAFFADRKVLPAERYIVTNFIEWLPRFRHVRTAPLAASAPMLAHGRNGRPMLIDPDTLTSKTRKNAFVIQDWIEEGDAHDRRG